MLDKLVAMIEEKAARIESAQSDERAPAVAGTPAS
jgi:hypothetical protein